MIPTIRSGDLRHRVQHQVATEVVNSIGHLVPTWSTVATYWGFVRPLSGRELVVAQQLKPEISHAVTMRYIGSDDPISPKDRLVYGSRVLNVEAVIDADNRHILYNVYCTEVVGAAASSSVASGSNLILHGYGSTYLITKGYQ